MSSSTLLGDSTLIYLFHLLTRVCGVHKTLSTLLTILLMCRGSNLSSLLLLPLLFHGVRRKVSIPKKLSWMHVSPLAMVTARANMYRNGYFSFASALFYFWLIVDFLQLLSRAGIDACSLRIGQ